MFKSKRYWMLLLPFLIVGVLLILFLPQEVKPLVQLLGIPFWILYFVMAILFWKFSDTHGQCLSLLVLSLIHCRKHGDVSIQNGFLPQAINK